MMKGVKFLCLVCFLMTVEETAGIYRDLDFIKPCSKRDPQLEACLLKSANIFVTRFQKGVPELGYPEVEPIILDEIKIVLGGGPNGYKAVFKNVTAFGVSSARVLGLRAKITDSEVQFQILLGIPKINAVAQYRSSGVLIMFPASGSGDYWGKYEGVKAKAFIRAIPIKKDGRTLLSLTQLKLDFAVDKMDMGVKNVNGGNMIMETILNQFINSNSQELLTEMKPDLQSKLVQLLATFVQNLFAQVPYDAWLID